MKRRFKQASGAQKTATKELDMKKRSVPSEKKIRIRFAIMGAAILAVAIFFAFYSGAFAYCFNFEGYVKGLDVKRYSLGEVVLLPTETREFADANGNKEYSVSVGEIKEENGEVSVKIVIFGSGGFNSGKLVRTEAVKNANENYVAEVILSNGEQTEKMQLKSRKISRARAEYVFCASSFSLSGGETVKLKNLVMNEYKRR